MHLVACSESQKSQTFALWVHLHALVLFAKKTWGSQRQSYLITGSEDCSSLMYFFWSADCYYSNFSILSGSLRCLLNLTNSATQQNQDRRSMIPSLKLLQVAACTGWILNTEANCRVSCKPQWQPRMQERQAKSDDAWQVPELQDCLMLFWRSSLRSWGPSMLSNMTDNESRCAQKCLLVIRYATHASCAGQRPNKMSFAYCIMWINTCRMQNKSKQSNNIKKQWLEFGRDCSFHPSIFRTFRLPGAAGLYATGAPERPATPKSRELMSSTFSTSSKCIRIILEALLQKPCIATLSYVGCQCARNLLSKWWQVTFLLQGTAAEAEEVLKLARSSSANIHAELLRAKATAVLEDKGGPGWTRNDQDMSEKLQIQIIERNR